MWRRLPPTALFLVVWGDLQAADLPKAAVSLDPPWYRVLTNDSVTLKCQGASLPGNKSTQWWHNGTLISSNTSTYFITAASPKDSGEYKCQTSLTTLSDPVNLEVHIGWLLLQAVGQVFKEGEKITLRCHGWKNKQVYKVTYHQNGKSQKYFHRNTVFEILNATGKHSGSYFCRGLIGKNNVSSESINIMVQGQAMPFIAPIFSSWHQVAFCLGMTVLFAVDTALYFFIQSDLRSFMGDWRNRRVKWKNQTAKLEEPQSQGPWDK
ncbi:low affinity immunoglobulin gamma Fc region receptor III-B-like [Echinops telfairi]|uniref:low affinity immunoglobulin gamma Fc region receptor III-B-like n=1 Tax=Echinops telfairi TaxID=9371 RepID=UPI001E1E10BB|nr:low affinity immunoglobulin gamma Fc region receptor III-B-like [Echinops telfairi]